MTHNQNLGMNDAVLLASLLYSCFDLQWEWDNFAGCARPIHKWLLVSYACVITFRLTHLLGSRAASLGSSDQAAGEFLLDLRHKGAVPRAMLTFTWVAALPFFAFLTVLGTAWLWEVVRDTPQCVPSSTHLWFSGFWLVLCYLWITIHAVLGVVAFVLERRVRRAEGDLREIEDDDVRQRWGQVSNLSGYSVLTEAVAPTAAGGLTPAAIKALPCEVAGGCNRSTSADQCECPICIMEVEQGEMVRYLPGCGHRFHKSCIDLWLLRRADCPLCKQHVFSTKDGQWV